MLVKFDKRFSKKYLVTASYALTARNGYNGILDLDDLDSTWGPIGARHILNVSGLVDFGWGVQLGFISAFASRGPVTPTVNGVDLDGDGISTETLPGLKFNCFNRGCGKQDMRVAVLNWNTNVATPGRRDAQNRVVPQLKLPDNFEFGDTFSSQDIRVTKTFSLKEQFKISVFAEVFNVFNIANLSSFSFTVPPATQADATTFGSPTQRSSQVFGSGGPRALQLGARVTF